MPVTVNGIGTTYIGKRNRDAYPGVCSSCHREVQLQSYETRLWFSILYLPVIPLGQKQIFDDCPVCRRHKLLPLGQWQAIRHDTLQEQRDQVQAKPNDAQSAIRLLETLSAFHADDEARELATVLAGKFANDASVQVALGQWHDHTGDTEQSNRCFLKAFELNPTDSAARRFAVIAHLRKDDPAAAERLLRQSPAIAMQDERQLFCWLADRYGKQNRDPEAFRILRELHQAVPELARDRNFCKAVQQTERALGHEESILPQRPFFLRPAFLMVAAACLVLAGVVGWSLTVASHQKLHVVNGFSKPIQVEFDSGARLTVAPQARQELEIGDGQHRATVQREGAPPEVIDFTVASGFINRLFRSPLFVLNPGGAAPLLWEQTVYSKEPTGEENPHRWHFNERFVTFDRVDFPFREFPAMLPIGGRRVTKTRIAVVQGGLSGYLIFTGIDDASKMQFAEVHLGDDPTDIDLIRAYVGLGTSSNQTERAIAFLESGLSRRPVVIEWHRMYQELRKGQGGAAARVEQYRRFLQAEPEDPALMYLLGRLEGGRDKPMALYNQAIKINPQLYYPWYAKARMLESDGRLPEALDAAAQARRINPEHPEIGELWFTLQLATGDLPAMEAELRQSLESEPLSVQDTLRLMQVLFARGKLIEMRQVCEQFKQTVSEKVPAEFRAAMTRDVDFRFLYLRGDFEQILRDAGDSADSSSSRFVALLELKRPNEAAKALMETDGLKANGYLQLCLAIAYRGIGNASEADKWEAGAVERLKSGDEDDAMVGDLFKRVPAITLDDIKQITLDPQYKALVALALAQRCPDQKTAFLQLARQMNYKLAFPHQFVSTMASAAES